MPWFTSVFVHVPLHPAPPINNYTPAAPQITRLFFWTLHSSQEEARNHSARKTSQSGAGRQQSADWVIISQSDAGETISWLIIITSLSLVLVSWGVTDSVKSSQMQGRTPLDLSTSLEKFFGRSKQFFLSWITLMLLLVSVLLLTSLVLLVSMLMLLAVMLLLLLQLLSTLLLAMVLLPLAFFPAVVMVSAGTPAVYWRPHCC
jgi:hypothetical protein